MGFELPTYNQVVRKAMIFEEEYLSSKKIKEACLSTKGSGSSSGFQNKKPRYDASQQQQQQSSYTTPYLHPAPTASRPQTQRSQFQGSQRFGPTHGGLN